MGLSACSVAACELIVGPPIDRELFPDEASAPEPDAEASTAEGSTSDASGEAAAVADAADAGDAADAADAADSPEESSDGGPAVDAPADAPADGPCQPGAGNLITNGNFSEGTTDWGIVSGLNGTLVADAGADMLCVSVPAGQEAGLAWLPGAQLACGSYSFSYSAVASQEGGFSIAVTVGHSSYPFQQDASWSDGVTTSWQEYQHPSSVPGGEDGDTSAGLSFEFTSPVAQEVCFKDVSLTADSN